MRPVYPRLVFVNTFKSLFFSSLLFVSFSSTFHFALLFFPSFVCAPFSFPLHPSSHPSYLAILLIFSKFTTTLSPFFLSPPFSCMIWAPRLTHTPALQAAWLPIAAVSTWVFRPVATVVAVMASGAPSVASVCRDTVDSSVKRVSQTCWTCVSLYLTRTWQIWIYRSKYDWLS